MDYLVIILLVAILLIPYLINLLSAYGKLPQWPTDFLDQWIKRNVFHK